MCAAFGTNGKSDIVLSRVFHSFDYGFLSKDIQAAAANALRSVPMAESKFLVLLGTYGDKAEWQKRTNLRGHQAIPLTRTSVSGISMVARLFLRKNSFEKIW